VNGTGVVGGNGARVAAQWALSDPLPTLSVRALLVTAIGNHIRTERVAR
jgi:hypothetical protein